MKSKLALCCLVFAGGVSAQSPDPPRIFLDADLSDSVRTLVKVSVLSHMTNQKPLTLYKNTPNGLVADEKPRKWRYRFQGFQSYWFYLKKDHTSSFQPHLFLEVMGVATYVSSKMGVGYTSRQSRYSLGFFGGQYERRVGDGFDISFRSKNFEVGGLYGAYFQFDPKGLSLFATVAKERRELFHRLYIGWKVRETINSRFVPKGLRIYAESETLIGAGAGISYQTPNGHFGINLSYLLPNQKERQTQRLFGNFLEEGIAIRLRYAWL